MEKNVASSEGRRGRGVAAREPDPATRGTARVGAERFLHRHAFAFGNQGRDRAHRICERSAGQSCPTVFPES
jgi:hypothetical protein